jgi:hypothetical protein
MKADPTSAPRPRRRTLLGIAAVAAAAPALAACSSRDPASARATPVDALSAASGSGGPHTIMVIRHAEKPTGSGSPDGVTPEGKKDSKSLTVQGWTRAGALIGLFAARDTTGGPVRPRPALPRPGSVYAADPDGESKRPAQTVTPLAAVLGGTPDTGYAKGQEAELAAALLAASGVVLVAWEHESIPAVIAHLGPVTPAPPASWPDDRFDVVWILTRHGDGWTFSQAPQLLLAGDLATTIA